MKDTLLFPREKVKKFFALLDRLSGGYPCDLTHYPWRDYQTVYTEDSNHIPSTREVFVHRTVNKWLKGKCLIIYRRSEYGQLYKQYCFLSYLHYENDWGSGYINVGLHDCSKPWGGSIFGGEKIKEYDALTLEGEWSDNKEKHIQLEEFLSMEDVPDKEYIFKAYDFSKYNKKTKKYYETTISLKAKTIKDAYREKERFEQECKETHSNLVLAPDIIEIKELNI